MEMGLLTKYLEKEREKRIKPYVKGNVLDIGCGPAKAINYPGVTSYFGVEFSKDFVENLRKIHKNKNAKFASMNLETDKINLPHKVDVVIMSAFLEHIANYENPIKQAINNLNEGGKIIITTPSRFGHKVHAVGADIGLFSKEAKEDHKAILSKNDFKRIAIKYNLKLEKFRYFQLFCNQWVVFEK